MPHCGPPRQAADLAFRRRHQIRPPQASMAPVLAQVWGSGTVANASEPVLVLPRVETQSPLMLLLAVTPFVFVKTE